MTISTLRIIFVMFITMFRLICFLFGISSNKVKGYQIKWGEKGGKGPGQNL